MVYHWTTGAQPAPSVLHFLFHQVYHSLSDPSITYISFLLNFIFFSPGEIGGIRAFDLRIWSRLFYHCANTACQQLSCYLDKGCSGDGCFYIIFTPLVPEEGFKPSILIWWVKCFTTELPGYSHLCLFSIFCLVRSIILYLIHQSLIFLFYLISFFSLLVKSVGFEPSTLEYEVHCSATVLILLTSYKVVTLIRIVVVMDVFISFSHP